MDCSILLFYNKDRGWLKYAIKSAEKQINKNCELIIINKNQSSSKNLNEGIKKCNGKYIKIMAEDDTLTDNCIIDLMATAKKTNADIIYAKVNNIYNNRIEVHNQRPLLDIQDFALTNPIHGASLMYKKTALEEIGMFNEKLEFAEEFEINLRLASKGYVFSFCNSIVYNYRIHTDQKSAAAYIESNKSGEYLKRRFSVIKNIKMEYANNLTPIKTA